MSRALHALWAFIAGMALRDARTEGALGLERQKVLGATHWVGAN